MRRSWRNNRTGAAVAASVLLHVVLAILFVSDIPVLRAPVPPPAMQVDLAPPILAPPTVAKPSTAPAQASSARRRKHVVASAPAPTFETARPAPVRPPSPLPPAARGRLAKPGPLPFAVPSGGGATAAGSTTHSPAILPGDEAGQGVREALRHAVGCSHQDYLHLTATEREDCGREFAAQGAIGAKQWVDPLSAAKRAEYNRVRDTCERLHHYATPLDEDAAHSASAPGKWGFESSNC